MKALRFGLVLLLLAFTTSLLPAAEPFRYPEGKHGKGELKYVDGVPVLTVQGSPEEIGEQIGVLGLKPVKGFPDLIEEAINGFGLKPFRPLLNAAAKGLYAHFPEEHRKEIEAMAKVSGTNRDSLILANTFLDLLKIGACSGFLVEADHSKTQSPLYGRNTDAPVVGDLADLSLIIVYRLEGKQPFASFTYPGLLMGTTGMNAAGLCYGVNDVRTSADNASRFDSEGVPTWPRLRRLMETCKTVADGEKLVRADKAVTLGNLLLCDKQGALVLEVTPKSVIARKPEKGLCSCTNHFRTKELATDLECYRFDALEKGRKQEKFSVEDVAKQMDAANQGDSTIQTVVYEPAELKMHLAWGKHSSAQPLKVLDLTPLFRDERK
jgi:isopenicillin-N N-acyltransferase like protein